MAKMNKLSKKIMVAFVADLGVEEIDKVQDLGDNKYQVINGLNSTFRVSFGKKRVIVTAKGCCWKRRDMTDHVMDIVRKINKLYKLNEKDAFQEYFDLLISNNSAQVVGCDEKITWYIIKLLGRKLHRMGFTNHSLDCVCGEASFIADCNMYPEMRHMLRYIDRKKTFNDLWKQAQEERADQLTGKDFDGDMMFKFDGYLCIPEF